ncbi:malto-oligosyltrehalose trehalohydrolase [Pseudomonas nitroreducens]|uniref:Malto-oligosyltrehalose trehalohydrolase n=1 Tax=Pseudomonas nitroreducens TaxID=46680 RepID=A0A246F8C2_PSENT|nr:malto-oligosyltrehalose trehalohydrolase [Pseudomonas nitroreducens]OWP49888.1 malto-oligosyltrehalose trehalohydrolase [Pseudomonas nitroreducens]
MTARHGAQVLPGGRVRFSLWAPDAQRVEVELSGGQRHDLEASADGWFSAEVPAIVGQTYRYRIDHELSVADPASRAQAGGVEGESLVVDPALYRWQHPQWRGRPWHEAVIYEVHVGLFDGFSALQGRLAELAALGVTAIELMPLNAFPGRRNWGYDGVLPYAPAGAYGEPDSLRQLIDTAHGLGLMVLVDVVYNHFGPQGNYLNRYASAFFHREQQTPWGPAIDFSQPAVREFFIGNAEMWVREYRVDGLRIDAVHAIGDEDFLLELASRARRAAEGRELHLVLENENNQAHLLQGPAEQGFDAQWNDDLHHCLHVLLTGEDEAYYVDYAQQTIEKLCRCLREGLVFQGQADYRGVERGEPSGALSPQAFVAFLQNHDQVGNRALGERLSMLTQTDRLRAASALVMLSPMVPMLFMGEEWGEQQPFLFFTDYQGDLARAVTVGRREEFKRFARFSEPGAAAWIPDPNDYQTFVASRPRPDQGDPDWREHYRQLLELRHRWLVPQLPGSRALDAQPLGERALSARWRLGDGSLWRIDLNLGTEEVAIEPPGESAQLLFCLGQTAAHYRHGWLAGAALVLSLEPSLQLSPEASR